MRPILKTSGLTSPTKWSIASEQLTARHRFESWSSNDDGSSVTSPDVSPIGTPLSSQVSDNYFNGNDWIALKLLCDNNWRQEFDSNGREVPLESHATIFASETRKEYQLFSGFTYASLNESALTTSIQTRLSPVPPPTYSRLKKRVKSMTYCTFCKNNNETPDVYHSHVVKDMDGRTICPVLRRYNCPKCNSGGGDDGHTLRYCPLNRPGADDYQPSIIKMLKNSRSADGKKKSLPK